MASTPPIERKLRQSQANLADLVTLNSQFVANGADPGTLPDDTHLRAFAIIEDAEDADLVRRAAALVPFLAAKGLALGALTPPRARYLLAVAPQIDGILTLGERFDLKLQDPPTLPPEGPTILCVSRVLAAWGQTLRFNVQVSNDAEFVLVRPDGAFGRGQAIHRLSTPHDHRFWFDLPCETGTVLVAAMAADGRLARHLIDVEVE